MKAAEKNKIREPEFFWGKSAAGVLLISRETKRILLLLRSKDVLEPETWGTISGRLEENEDPMGAALRELSEEVSLPFGTGHGIYLKQSYIYKKDNFIFYNHIGIIEKEFIPKLNWENTEYKWCAIGDYPAPLHFGFQKLIEAIDLEKEIKEMANGGNIGAVELKSFKNWFGKSKVINSNGEPLVVYHGTVSDFDIFDINEGNPEADWGRGFYFTNEVKDVNANYFRPDAPDITNKIARLAETISGKEDITYEEAEAQAKKKILPSHGSVIPAYLCIKKPLEIGGGKRVYWDSAYDEENDTVTGKFWEFQQHLKDAFNYGGYTIDQSSKSLDSAIVQLQENVGFEGGWVDDIIEELKCIIDSSMITDEEGNMSGNEVLRLAIIKMGYDGIIDYSVDKKFGSQRRLGQKMKGMTPDAIRYIVFEPTQIKSAIGNRTFSKKNPSIIMEQGGIMQTAMAPIVRANVSRIAKKHGVPKEYILEQLAKGERIEAEHDKTIAYIKSHPSVSYEVARQMISLNHIDEAKEYYGQDFDIFEKTVEEKNYAQGGTLSLESLRKSWEKENIENYISENKGVIKLSQIIVPKDKRSGGIGTKAMIQLINYADATNQKIILTPSPDFGGNKNRLKKFYKRFGFIENKGHKRDFTISESMYRNPEKAKGGNLQTLNYIAISNSKSQKFNEYSYVLDKYTEGKLLKLKLLKYMYLTNAYQLGAPRGWVIVETGILPEQFDVFYREEVGTKKVKIKSNFAEGGEMDESNEDTSDYENLVTLNELIDNLQENCDYHGYTIIDTPKHKTLIDIFKSFFKTKNIDNFQFTLRASDIRHILDHHGVENEKRKDQEPITLGDFRKTQVILAHPDSVEKSKHRDRRGVNRIEYTKNINGVYYCIEEILTARRFFNVKTFFKKKP